ncbi:CHAT domain-containing protein [Oscillatoriales cyanobacterium LEGE 11467]|uniref:CHAT domain-containing protein n=1 Tax=Zarconia navalis LEGE 11467 TaxID=1828826 RepID=A0A928VW93_9CYAN|nr:CHAT domain-containing protein [Zarconia navalis]MBE9040443.1 CHAT domain-containing protein [Zarconia navalis LEGE 11467]
MFDLRSIRLLLAVLLPIPFFSFKTSGVASPTPQIAIEAAIEPEIESSISIERGKQLYDAGRFAEAVRVWEQAVSEDVLQQALSLTYLARAYQALGEWDKSRRAIEDSLDLLQNEPDLDSWGLMVLGQTLNTQGTLYLDRGDAATALDTWQKAESVYDRADDELGELGSRINQAQALQNLGLYQQAQRILERVNDRLQTQTDLSLKAMGLRSLGAALQAFGDVSGARKALERSLSISEALADEAGISVSLLMLGNVLRRSDREVALELYKQSADLAPQPLNRLQAQLNQLRLLQTLDRWDEALVRTIESDLNGLQASRSTVYARVNFAQTLLAASGEEVPEDRQIAQLLAAAISQAERLGDIQAQSYALGTLGRVYERAGQWQEARELSERALSLAQSRNAAEITYLWQWQLGRILNAQGDRTGMLAAYTGAIETLGTLRDDLVANPEEQVLFQEQIEPIYREAIALLLAPEPGNLIPSQKNLKQARNYVEALQLAELDNFFRQACLDAQPQQIDRIDPTAAVFHPIILDDRLAVILSLPDRPLHLYQTELPKSDVEDVFANMRQSMSRSFPTGVRLQVSEQIYDWLIRPVEAQLEERGIETLVFVLDGSMRNLPMAALYDGRRYLIEKYAVSRNSGLQLLAPRSLSAEDLNLLAGGLTEARQGFSELPGVDAELAKISQILPTQVFLNQEFTPSTLEESIERFSIPVVHLATHGKFSSTADETFILTWDGKLDAQGLERLLTARESNRLSPIELLILSACQTASGDRRAALGLAGVAVRSGARSTIASLWRVNDRSTADLMVALYRSLVQPGTSKAQALRNAQLTLLEDPQTEHPFFWSAFVLVGNWL